MILVNNHFPCLLGDLLLFASCYMVSNMKFTRNEKQHVQAFHRMERPQVDDPNYTFEFYASTSVEFNPPRSRHRHQDEEEEEPEEEEPEQTNDYLETVSSQVTRYYADTISNPVNNGIVYIEVPFINTECLEIFYKNAGKKQEPPGFKISQLGASKDRSQPIFSPVVRLAIFNFKETNTPHIGWKDNHKSRFDQIPNSSIFEAFTTYDPTSFEPINEEYFESLWVNRHRILLEVMRFTKKYPQIFWHFLNCQKKKHTDGGVIMTEWKDMDTAQKITENWTSNW